MERPTTAIRESPDSYTTPALLVDARRATEIVITGGDCVTGHDPATGKELWRADGLNPENNPSYRIVASPVVAGDLVYAPTACSRCSRSGPAAAATSRPSHRVWSFDNGPDVPTPVTDGTLPLLVNDNGHDAGASTRRPARSSTGPERLKPGTYSASPVLADGKIYVTNEDGVTTVFKAGPKFEVAGRERPRRVHAQLAGHLRGQIFMRTEKHLYAIGR